jgi:hypothetical protein
MTLDELVDNYQRDPKCCRVCEDELVWFASLPTLRRAISESALCNDSNGGRHPHQRRLKKMVLEAAERALLTVETDLAEAVDFEGLYTLVRNVILPIHGIGDLAVYDITTRIGAFLRLRPHAVYLHAGTAEGARSLGILSASGDPVPVDAFPAPLRRLSADHIENFLCIYKRQLKTAAG